MGYLEGILGGFTTRKGEYEKEQLRQAELANARESDFYKLLLEKGTPEFQAMAATGLLESARTPTRKGGLRGWLGEMQANPMYEQIKGLIGTPVQTEEPVLGVPSRSTTGYIGTPPATTGSLAQPETAATEPGAPPLTQPSPAPTSALQTAEQPAPIIGSQTVSKPRQVLMSPEEAMVARYSGQERGELEGVIKTLEPYIGREAAIKQALEERARSRGLSGAGLRSIFGEAQDANGEWYPTTAVFNPATGEHEDLGGNTLRNFRRSMVTGSRSYGTDREAISLEPEFGGRPFREQPPEIVAKINSEAIRRTREIAYQRGTGAGEAKIETELASPIGITAGAEQGLDPTTPLGMLQGIIPNTTEQRNRMAALQALAPQAITIRNLVSKVFPPAGGPVAASVVLGQKRLVRDPDFMQLEAQINLALGNVARTLAAESGRLTEQDAQRARTALADLEGYTDTRESALAKLDVVDAMLKNIAASIRTPTQQLQDRDRQAAPQSRVGAPPPNPNALLIGGRPVFNGADGELHFDSPTGPVVP